MQNLKTPKNGKKCLKWLISIRIHIYWFKVVIFISACSPSAKFVEHDKLDLGILHYGYVKIAQLISDEFIMLMNINLKRSEIAKDLPNIS